MWFSRAQFELGVELKRWGVEPRFEPGDIVARGFADLGYEEFQVLPSARLLSLTAGTVSSLPADHAAHFFWIPSLDEATTLLERKGVSSLSCTRVDAREWIVEVQIGGARESSRASSLHEALLVVLCAVYRRAFKQE